MVSFPLRQREGTTTYVGCPPAAFLDSVCSGRVGAGVPAHRPRGGDGLRLRVSAGFGPASPTSGVTGCVISGRVRPSGGLATTGHVVPGRQRNPFTHFRVSRDARLRRRIVSRGY